jgi:hypothetical protein
VAIGPKGNIYLTKSICAYSAIFKHQLLNEGPKVSDKNRSQQYTSTEHQLPVIKTQ